MQLPVSSLMMDVVGTELSQAEAELLKHPLVGGVILFSRNFVSSEQLINLTTAIRQSVDKPLLIAVDHEGGRVQRFRTDGFTHIPAMGKLADEQLPLAQVTELGWLMASECLAHGIDLSFAPVLDLERGSDVVGDRAFSRDINTTIEYASAWCEGMKQAGMACVGKHFPGHGSTKEDSHVAAPVDQRSFADIMNNDGAVFSTMINNNKLDAIMPAHIQFANVDPSPVGYSKFWLQQVVKQDLAFNGVLFSDDLSMVGAGKDLSYLQRAEYALSAGCDMALICNNQEAVAELLSDANLQLGNTRSTGLNLCFQGRVTLAELRGSQRWQQAKELAITTIKKD